MKAMIFNQYGSPDVLHLDEVSKPVPGDHEVLIKMQATCINDWDWALLHGVPFINRISFGLRKPKFHILGSDVAGIVEAVGKNVTRFKPGDEVFGDLSGTGSRGWGGLAEYHCAQESALLHKPTFLSFEQAASIPQSASLAWNGLLKAKVKSGTKILINGAAGGTGSFAIQMAKHLGAEVTGTARMEKLDFLHHLGCDHVVDFTQENFTRNECEYDVILDLMAHYSLFDNRRALKPEGNYIFVGGKSSIIFQMLIPGLLLNAISKKKCSILMHKANKGMTDIIDLIQAEKITPIIDKCFPLQEAANAFRYFGESKKKGKVVVKI